MRVPKAQRREDTFVGVYKYSLQPSCETRTRTPCSPGTRWKDERAGSPEGNPADIVFEKLRNQFFRGCCYPLATKPGCCAWLCRSAPETARRLLWYVPGLSTARPPAWPRDSRDMPTHLPACAPRYTRVYSPSIYTGGSAQLTWGVESRTGRGKQRLASGPNRR